MKKVLIVEDYLLLRVSITFMLSHEDTVAISCDNLECAEKALMDHAFDLVITDLSLSGTGDGMEGMRLLQMVKKRNSSIPVIMMTASGSAETEKNAYLLGAYHYFEKPFDIGLLAQKVQALGISTRRSFLDRHTSCAGREKAHQEASGWQNTGF
ncbi:MAG: response regulator [Nitrospirae bacterium]|nr:response regulator [Nitrospirota bacterium]